MATTTKKKSAIDEAYNNQATANQEGIKKLDEYKNLVNQKTSALSSLGQANQQAMKYAQNSALAQGYATQGAALQNAGSLQNAYMNQVGNVNQQFQQQLGNLKNTTSKEYLTGYANKLANIEGDQSLTDEQKAQQIINAQDYYYKYLGEADLEAAQTETQTLLDAMKSSQERSNIVSSYGVDLEKPAASVAEIIQSSGTARAILGTGAGGEDYGDKLREWLKNRSSDLQNGQTIQVKNKYFVYYNGNLYESKNKPNSVDYQVVRTSRNTVSVARHTNN